MSGVGFPRALRPVDEDSKSAPGTAILRHQKMEARTVQGIILSLKIVTQILVSHTNHHWYKSV